MADKRKPPELGGGPSRKRAAPTIDLKATEVPPDPVEEAPVAAAAPAAPPEEPVKPEPESEPKRAAPPPPPPLRSGLGAGVVGGVIGAVIVAAIGGGLWFAGYMPSSSTQPSDLPRRLATLEKQVQAPQNRLASKVDTAALDKTMATLSQRVSKLEGEIGNLPPGDKAATQKLAALEATVKSLNDTVSALGKRADTIAATAKQAQQDAAAAQKDIGTLKQSVQSVASAQGQTTSVAAGAFDALRKKVAALETVLDVARGKLGDEIKNVRGDVTNTQKQVAQATAGERATRLALSATALRNAVMSGAPYAAELAQAKVLGADAKALAPLARFASSGLPSRNELANELIKLVPTMRKIGGAKKPSGDFLARLQANAEKLVRITPVEAPSGNDPSDVLARIEAGAAHADIANALSDLAKLPDDVRTPAKGWIAKAKARQAALAAARNVAAHAARALGKG
ncbi:MAG: hypothetical protein P8Z80_08740 [Pseudolabrys sp.]